MQKRILVTIGIFSTLNLALIGGLVATSVISIGKYVQKIEKERQNLETQYISRIYMRDTAASMSAIRARLDLASGLAVREGGELNFITSLERTAEKSGVKQSIALETANQKNLTTWEKEIPLGLEFSGTYPQVLRHLNAIERLPYSIIITGLQISADQQLGNENPDGRVKVSVSAIIYWQSKNTPPFINGAPVTIAQ